MRKRWTEVPKDNIRGQWAALYVTMDPKGRIAMSRVTYERLGAPAAFNILFDEVNMRIGLKPTSLSLRNAYRACVTSTSTKGQKGGRQIYAYRLVQDYGIDIKQTIQFDDADIEDGILVLDLRTARISERSRNHYRNRAQPENGRNPAAHRSGPVAEGDK